MNKKVVNLADYRKNNAKRTPNKNSEHVSINKYKEALKSMSKEEILAIEELLEN